MSNIREVILYMFTKWKYLSTSQTYTTAVLTFLLFDILDTTAFYAYNPCQIGHETSIFVISIILFFYFVFQTVTIKSKMNAHGYFCDILKTVDVVSGLISYSPDILQISPIMYHT